jgi:hypothetical protein
MKQIQTRSELLNATYYVIAVTFDCFFFVICCSLTGERVHISESCEQTPDETEILARNWIVHNLSQTTNTIIYDPIRQPDYPEHGRRDLPKHLRPTNGLLNLSTNKIRNK